MNRSATAALAAIAAVAIAGCSDPYSDTASTPQGEHAEHAEPDVTTGVRTAPDVAGQTRGAERIAREFVATSLTYSPDTWGRQQRQLRARATGALAGDLAPHVPDSDTQDAMAESQLTSRAKVLVSDVESGTPKRAAVIVVAKVLTGSQGTRSETASYPVYRVGMRRVDGAWKVEAMDAP